MRIAAKSLALGILMLAQPAFAGDMTVEDCSPVMDGIFSSAEEVEQFSAHQDETLEQRAQRLIYLVDCVYLQQIDATNITKRLQLFAGAIRGFATLNQQFLLPALDDYIATGDAVNLRTAYHWSDLVSSKLSQDHGIFDVVGAFVFQAGEAVRNNGTEDWSDDILAVKRLPDLISHGAESGEAISTADRATAIRIRDAYVNINFTLIAIANCVYDSANKYYSGVACRK